LVIHTQVPGKRKMHFRWHIGFQKPPSPTPSPPPPPVLHGKTLTPEES
jgi:hypothetical protein